MNIISCLLYICVVQGVWSRGVVQGLLACLVGPTHHDTAVGLGVFGGFITPANTEWRWPRVGQVRKEVDELISSDASKPQHYGSPCVY